MQVVLLVARAKVLAEIDTVEEAVLQQCLHVIKRIVQAYRGLWPKQRLPVHAALNIFLSAIAPKQAVLQSVLPRFVSILLTYTLKPAEANLIAGDLLMHALNLPGLLKMHSCAEPTVMPASWKSLYSMQSCKFVFLLLTDACFSAHLYANPCHAFANMWHTRGQKTHVCRCNANLQNKVLLVVSCAWPCSTTPALV